MKILFVCTGNTCRSPMAEGLLRKKAEDRGICDLEVSSAGIFAFESQRASDNALSAAGSHGVDLKAHRARRLGRQQIDLADLVLTMTESHKAAILGTMPNAKDKVYTLNGFIGQRTDVMDPFGCSLEIYEQTLLELEKSLELLLEKLK